MRMTTPPPPGRGRAGRATEITRMRRARRRLDVDGVARVPRIGSCAAGDSGRADPGCGERARLRRPHPVASSLRSSRAGIVGVVDRGARRARVSEPRRPRHDGRPVREPESVGFGRLLLPGRAHSSPAQELLMTLPVDAVVFATRGEEFDLLLPTVRARGVPMVGIEGPHADDITLVEVDDEGGMTQMAQHVAALGHRDVGVAAHNELGEERPPRRPVPIGWDIESNRKSARSADGSKRSCNWRPSASGSRRGGRSGCGSRIRSRAHALGRRSEHDRAARTERHPRRGCDLRGAGPGAPRAR